MALRGTGTHGPQERRRMGCCWSGASPPTAWVTCGMTPCAPAQLDPTDPGFDFSVRSVFRDRLVAGSAEALLLEKLLERCRTMGLIKARG
jgi:hypothetical protein